MSKLLLSRLLMPSLCAMLALSSCQRRQDHPSDAKEDFLSSLLNVTKGPAEKESGSSAQNGLSKSDPSATEERELTENAPGQPATPHIYPEEARSPAATQNSHKREKKQEKSGASPKALELFNQAKEALAAGDIARSKELYLESCSLGYLYGCHRFGWHQKGGIDKQGGIQFYEVACREGFWKSCNNLGWIAEKEKNYEKAADYYSWACLNKHPGSCQNLQRVTHRRQLAH